MLAGRLNHLSMMCLCRESRDGYQGQVADEYAVLSKALWSGQYRSVAPRDFRVCTFVYQYVFICYIFEYFHRLVLVNIFN